MNNQKVGIIRTGVANVASVQAALARLGCEPELIETARDVERLDSVVLPGVGSFAAGMASLNRLDLAQPLRERFAADRPTLAICLGLQLLCAASEESPGVKGLGVIQQEVRALRGSGLRFPQFGWNTVAAPAGMTYLQDGYAYYANSYGLLDDAFGWQAAVTMYGSRFAAAIERGNCLACQFHPELSGSYGSELLGRWLSKSREAQPC